MRTNIMTSMDSLSKGQKCPDGSGISFISYQWLALIFATILLVAGNAEAATCYSQRSGDWNRGQVWDNGSNCGRGEPSNGDSVVIQNGDTVTADQNTNTVADITINGTLQVTNRKTVTLSGNFTNNGTFSASNNTTVAFVGTAQTITGNITFANLTVGTGTTLTLAGNIVISGTTNLTQANLTSTCPTNYTVTLANGTVLNSCQTSGGGGGAGSVTASPGTCISDPSNGSTYAWSALGNVGASDNTYAQADGRNSSVTQYLKCTGYNFNIPANATITGISLDVEGHSRWTFSDAGVHLVKGDVIQAGTNYANNNSLRSNTDITLTYGTATDLWGGSWTPADINSASFGAAFAALRGPYNRTDTVFVDYMPITVHYTVPSGTMSCVTFRDTFSTQSYSNNDGTANWTGNWVETGDDRNGSPNRGTININANRLAFDGNSTFLSGFLGGLIDIFGNNAPYIQRGADLSPYTTATLTFDYANTGNLEANDIFELMGSADGGATWTSIQQLTGVQTAATYSYDLSAYIAGNFQLALSGKASRPNESFYIDNVQIEACAVTTPASFQITHDNFGINCVPEPIRVEAIASDGTTFAGYTGTITLDTGSGKGTWSLASGNGILTDATTNDGLASYAFDLADNGIATFNLSYQEGISPITITAQDGAAAGSSTPLAFSPSGFTVTANPLTDPTALPDNIGTQTAGSSFALHITAYGQTPTNATCGIIETYTGAKSLKFWSEYNNPATGSKQISIDGSAVAVGEVTATAQPVSFTAGTAQVTGSYPDVGLITINMKDDTTADPNLPTGIRGGSNPFVVKPHHFSIANVQCSDGTANPASADYTGNKFCAAGQSFSATVSALEAGGTVTPNFGKESTPESVVLSAPSWSAASAYTAGAYILPTVFNGFTYEATTGGTSSATEPTWPVTDGATVVDGGIIWKAHAGYMPALVSPAAGINKPLVQSYTFTNGSASATLSWPEVGIIQLTPHIQDGDYLGGGDVTTTATGNVGRFYADHFAVTLSAANFAPADNTFTYMGQPFSYSTAPSLTITAMSTGNALLENYQANYWMLGSSLPSATTNGFQYGDNVGGASTLAAPASPILYGDTSAVAGSLTLPVHSTGSFTYQRPAALIAPFDADVSLQISVQDSDGAAGNASLASIGFVGDSDASPNPFNTTVDNMLRFGRAVLADTYGRETEAQRMDFNTHYYDGTDFVVNTDDLSTSYSVAPADPSTAPALTDPACTDPGTDAVACNQVSVGGTAVLPGSFFTLSAPGANNIGKLQYTLTVDPWLQFDWGSGTYTDNPFATATFGIFRGDDRFIYWREVE